MSDMVHRLLITGSDGDLLKYHFTVLDMLNAIERRGQTMLYTCYAEHYVLVLGYAKDCNVTVQEWDGKEWAVIVQGEMKGWAMPPCPL